MHKNVKIGATGLGAAATLFAAAFSIGGGGQAASGHIAGVSPAARSEVARCLHGCEPSTVRSAFGVLRSIAVPGNASRTESGTTGVLGASAATSTDTASAPSLIPQGSNADRITLKVPRRVTVILPNYEGGSPPRVTPPTYEAGSPPSVEHQGREITIDLGEPGSVTPPAVQPGEPGTFTPPGVIIE